ncbi:MAG TPA: hypothetical protein P5081_13865 [Phycisphaerae bacterium]|nr:hypothetical protein [Phycisphaerae bacterium]HRW53957.1 hypothetical protein [Phycisphaerae bacterium]
MNHLNLFVAGFILSVTLTLLAGFVNWRGLSGVLPRTLFACFCIGRFARPSNRRFGKAVRIRPYKAFPSLSILLVSIDLAVETVTFSCKMQGPILCKGDVLYVNHLKKLHLPFVLDRLPNAESRVDYFF